MWKFLGEGLNLNPSSDTVASFVARPPRNARDLMSCQSAFSRLEFLRQNTRHPTFFRLPSSVSPASTAICALSAAQL